MANQHGVPGPGVSLPLHRIATRLLQTRPFADRPTKLLRPGLKISGFAPATNAARCDPDPAREHRSNVALPRRCGHVHERPEPGPPGHSSCPVPPAGPAVF